jgi:hypothetical protein
MGLLTWRLVISSYPYCNESIVRFFHSEKDELSELETDRG